MKVFQVRQNHKNIFGMRSSLVYPGVGIDIDLAIMKNKILRVGTGLDLKFPEGHTEEFQSYIIVNGESYNLYFSFIWEEY